MFHLNFKRLRHATLSVTLEIETELCGISGMKIEDESIFGESEPLARDERQFAPITFFLRYSILNLFTSFLYFR